MDDPDKASPARLALRMHERFNRREDVDALDEILHPDFYSHPLAGGLETVKQSRRAALERYPEVRTVVEDVLVDGDRVAIRSTTYGVDTPPSEPSASMLEIARVEDGLIIELWGATTRSMQRP